MSNGTKEEEEGSDWLNDSDDERQAGTPAGKSNAVQMAARDSAKVEQKMYDEGYREGISAGKESMIQPGFDAGYTQQGAPVGRALGRLNGTLQALRTIISSKEDNEDLSKRLEALDESASLLTMNDLVERDWEAIEHAKEHGEDPGSFKRETLSEKALRESLISKLQKEADSICQDLL